MPWSHCRLIGRIPVGNFKNCGLFFKVGQIMFKWTFLERENIVESRTGLHLSLAGLDVEIMANKDW